MVSSCNSPKWQHIRHVNSEKNPDMIQYTLLLAQNGLSSDKCPETLYNLKSLFGVVVYSGHIVCCWGMSRGEYLQERKHAEGQTKC